MFHQRAIMSQVNNTHSVDKNLGNRHLSLLLVGTALWKAVWKYQSKCRFSLTHRHIYKDIALLALPNIPKQSESPTKIN